MPISIACPGCGAKMTAPDNYEGRLAKYGQCKLPFKVTAPGTFPDWIEPAAAPLAIVAAPADDLPFAIVLAEHARPEVPCPYCAELILQTARKCRFCNEILDPEPKRKLAAPEPRDDGFQEMKRNIKSLRRKLDRPREEKQVVNVITHAESKSRSKLSILFQPLVEVGCLIALTVLGLLVAALIVAVNSQEK